MVQKIYEDFLEKYINFYLLTTFHIPEKKNLNFGIPLANILLLSRLSDVK